MAGEWKGSQEAGGGRIDPVKVPAFPQVTRGGGAGT